MNRLHLQFGVELACGNLQHQIASSLAIALRKHEESFLENLSTALRRIAAAVQQFFDEWYRAIRIGVQKTVDGEQFQIAITLLLRLGGLTH